MPAQRSYQRALAAVLDPGPGPCDSVALRRAVLAELGRVVPFDAYAWVATDPATSVGAAPLADLSSCADLSVLPRLIRLKYATGVNRWTGLPAAAGTLLGATGGDPARSLLWRELLAGLGVHDVLSAVFRDHCGCWGFLDLWRTGPQGFDAGEVALVAGSAPAVTAALRRCHAGSFGPAGGASGTGPALLLVSDDLAVVGSTDGTAAVLRALLPPSAGADPVPAAAYNVAAQLLAVEAGVDANPAEARVRPAGGGWVSFRAARVSGPEHRIAVSVERSSPAERLDLLTRVFRLTSRESELLAVVASGADTRGAARTLSLSEHTVQDHLKSVFAKTGCHSRTELVSRVTGA